jgi:pimeloyl-ACP methyl ester carboxylesterase
MSLLENATSLQEFDLQIPSGRIHAQRAGRAGARLTLCLPGLSANMKSFDFLMERLDCDDAQMVAIDLRGRGRSEVTAAGTYGWIHHAEDVFAIADARGAARFSVVGHSMGGAVAMVCAQIDTSRIERAVLVDMCGTPDETVLGPINAAVSRLGAVYPSAEAFTALVRQIGTVEPWSEYWERYFRYDLHEVDGGVAPGSSLQAVMEDGAFGAGALAFGERSGIHALWQTLTMPTLLLRASRELAPGFGFVVPERERDRFVADVPGVQAVDVDANHYGIITHEASAVAAGGFLGVELHARASNAA